MLPPAARASTHYDIDGRIGKVSGKAGTTKALCRRSLPAAMNASSSAPVGPSRSLRNSYGAHRRSLRGCRAGRQADGRLHVGDLQIAAEMRIDVFVAVTWEVAASIRRPEIVGAGRAQQSRPVAERSHDLVGVWRYRTPRRLAHRDVVGRMEAERADIAEGADLPGRRRWRPIASQQSSIRKRPCLSQIFFGSPSRRRDCRAYAIMTARVQVRSPPDRVRSCIVGSEIVHADEDGDHVCSARWD